MHSESADTSLLRTNIEVTLDGLPVGIPAERRSLASIRSYLETFALERQRVLCAFSLDGQPAKLSQPLSDRPAFRRIEGQTVDLDELPLLLLQTALQQTNRACNRVESAITLVLINDIGVACELWWDVAKELKEPLLTLNLLPEATYTASNGSASLMQVRRWQLQQLADLIKDVDEVCRATDTTSLSNALENRVLPWLLSLHNLISLWQETVLAGFQPVKGCAA
jgi:hypothetical protein